MKKGFSIPHIHNLPILHNKDNLPIHNLQRMGILPILQRMDNQIHQQRIDHPDHVS